MTPFKGTNRVTSGFRLPGRANHNGIDVTNPYGDWTVREVTGATVTKIYNNAVRGLVLETTTSAGDLQRYQHLKSTLVKVGQKLPQGTPIAISGNTGDCDGTARADNEYTAGRHLHFEVLKGGKTIVNPSAWLGLPNVVGDYPSNDSVDGDAPPAPVDPTPGTMPVPCEGVDVAKYQGDIDWPAVAASGKKFAMIRAGSWVSGKLTKDPYFEKNYTEAKAAGLRVGTYFYSHSWTVDSIHNETAFFLNIIKGKQFDMPVCMDYEYDKEIVALTNERRTENVKAFLQDLEDAGCFAALYASTNFINSLLNYTELTCWDMWAAQYGTKCTCALPFGLWQHHGGPQKNSVGVETWPGGTCPGISGWVDLDTCYKDYPSIIRAAGLNGYEAGDIPPAPTNALYEYSDIVASAGDGKDIEALLNEKGIPFTKKEL